MNSLTFCFFFLAISFAKSSSTLVQDGIIKLNASEAFMLRFPLDSYKQQFGILKGLKVFASHSDQPDLPFWMRLLQTENEIFLYGKSNSIQSLPIDLIVQDQRSFETLTDSFTLNFASNEGEQEVNQIELRLSNLDLPQFFDRQQDLLSIFQDHLWKGTTRCQYKLIARPTEAFGRLPLNPDTKEGVIVRIGSSRPFSSDLLQLDREMQPIRRRTQCPAHYRSTSFEYLFRQKQFQIDWCSFKLIRTLAKNAKSDPQSSENEIDSETVVNFNEFDLPRLVPINYKLISVNHVVIPTFFSALFIYALVWATHPMIQKSLNSEFRSTTVFL